jgi:hypothetical protein
MALTLQKLVNLHEDSEYEDDEGEKPVFGVNGPTNSFITGSTSIEDSSPAITIRKGQISLWTRMLKALFPTSQITKKEKEKDL